MNYVRYGIIGAMPEEVEALRNIMTDVMEENIGRKVFYTGLIAGKSVVLTCSGIGKVSAATATSVLIVKYHCDAIINTGVAGGLQDTAPLDLVISTATTQHDFDLTIFGYKPGQVPSFEPEIKACPELTKVAFEVAQKLGAEYNFNSHLGLIVSGDKFIAGAQERAHIDKIFPAAKATEMEGAAIGEASTIFNVPYVVIRSISDNADPKANMTFEEVLPLATRNSQEIVKRMMEAL